MTHIENGYEGKNSSTRCYETGAIERTSRTHISPYGVVVTTAMASLLVAVLGWMLLEIRDVRSDRELTAVAVERQRTAEARVQDLQNQIKALRREQDLQDKQLRQVNDWRTLRTMQ